MVLFLRMAIVGHRQNQQKRNGQSRAGSDSQLKLFLFGVGEAAAVVFRGESRALAGPSASAQLFPTAGGIGLYYSTCSNLWIIPIIPIYFHTALAPSHAIAASPIHNSHCSTVPLT